MSTSEFPPIVELPFVNTPIIPKNIFQTHKSKQYILGKPKLEKSVASWIQFKPEYKYYFYDDQACDLFMKEKMGGDIYKAYQRLPMAVMKADLWRYCVIYYYGGIYADTDAQCLMKPDLFINESLLTVAPEQSHNFFCQWTFAAPAGSPLLKRIIDLSVERILSMKKIRGEHVIHYLTGPAVFTEGILQYLNENQHPTFSHVTEYHKYPKIFLKVFHPETFHKKIVLHTFAGSDADGWKNERYRKLL